MGKLRTLGIFIMVIVLLAACAHQPIQETADAPGFFLGLLHGLIAVFSLIGSLFWQVHAYAFPNSGFWYETGFLLGFSTSLLIFFLSVMARIGGWLS